MTGRARTARTSGPRSLHGLRKAEAAWLTDGTASGMELASNLANMNTKLGMVYTKCTRKANRSKMACSGFAKLVNVSDLFLKLYSTGKKLSEIQQLTKRSGSP